MNTDIDIRPAHTRFPTDIGWLTSQHSFSFGSHFDPRNVEHGLLIVANDDTVAPGGGFNPHSHADMEIISWVLDGELEHQDSTGNHGVIYPGLVQRMSAGTGISHSEMNASKVNPVHFLQMWVVPDTLGIEPSYEEVDVAPLLASGGLVAVASGQGHDGAIAINQAGAVMWVGRLVDDEAVAIPQAPFVHVFVAKGSVSVAESELTQGDAIRLTNNQALSLTSNGASEIVIWESQTKAGR
jgi:redox-sensitive bicupin YhaK (pirin superfamily)